MSKMSEGYEDDDLFVVNDGSDVTDLNYPEPLIYEPTPEPTHVDRSESEFLDDDYSD
jgi:hypothetical protein